MGWIVVRVKGDEKGRELQQMIDAFTLTPAGAAQSIQNDFAILYRIKHGSHAEDDAWEFFATPTAEHALRAAAHGQRVEPTTPPRGDPAGRNDRGALKMVIGPDGYLDQFYQGAPTKAEQAVEGIWVARHEGMDNHGRIDWGVSLVGLREGTVTGIDWEFRVRGTYRFEGEAIVAKVTIERHSPPGAAPSVWGDFPADAKIDLSGKWHHERMTLEGGRPASGGTDTQVTLKKVMV